MVKELNNKNGKRNISKTEFFYFIGIFVGFLLLVHKYVFIGLGFKDEAIEIVETAKVILSERMENEEVICEEEEVKITLSDGEICRANVENEQDFNWLYVFESYPKSAYGKEIIYSFLDEGDIKIANEYLDNEYRISRFDPVYIENITWDEDPYEERYWRFVFFSLQETRHLLKAFRETGDERYKD